MGAGPISEPQWSAIDLQDLDPHFNVDSITGTDPDPDPDPTYKIHDKDRVRYFFKSDVRGISTLLGKLRYRKEWLSIVSQSERGAKGMDCHMQA